MQATGIVAEYNPFHNGHLHHVAQTKKITQQAVIAVMSASFMQRGEPAILNKWQRAALAACGGVDLVLELPCAASLRSAQYFAASAVQLLAATGCVNTLSCGVENPQLDFADAAQTASSAAAQSKLRSLLAEGLSYAQAWEKVLGAANTFSAPNNILALEYTKALLAQKAAIKPLYIKREDAGYNSNELATLASATAIRQALAQGSSQWQQAVPCATRIALTGSAAGYDEKLLWQLICYRLRTLSAAAIRQSSECSEGLENVLKAAANATSLEQALEKCTKKRYTKSRIRRLFMQLILGADFPRITSAPSYLRILAFNDTGRQLLKQMKKTAALPLITKIPAEAKISPQLELEIRATDVWSMLQSDAALNRIGNDYLNSPAYVK